MLQNVVRIGSRFNSRKVHKLISRKDIFGLKKMSHTQDENGWSPLVHCMKRGETEIFKELIKKNPFLNMQDKKGMTPFMHAVGINKKYADMLQRNGVDIIMIHDNEGHNGIYYLKQAHGFLNSIPERGHSN